MNDIVQQPTRDPADRPLRLAFMLSLSLCARPGSSSSSSRAVWMGKDGKTSTWLVSFRFVLLFQLALAACAVWLGQGGLNFSLGFDGLAYSAQVSECCGWANTLARFRFATPCDL